MTLLYGGRSLAPERHWLAGGVQVVVGTPGRTLDHLRQGNLSLGQLTMLVLDEGDEMLDRGFAPDVESILSHTPAARQTALFSATMPDWVLRTAARHLRNPVTVRVDREIATPPEIRHTVYEVDSTAKFNALRTLLDNRGDGPVLVFGRTKHGVKKLARQLEDLGYPVAALQGNLSQGARERVMSDFRLGGVPIMVATNVAARGLDVAGIEQVINYELPETAELFTHRAGRTGRMGNDGEAITFVTPEDIGKWWQIERALGRRLPRLTWPRGTGAAIPVPGSPTSLAPAVTAGSSRFASLPTAPARSAPSGAYRFRTASRRGSQSSPHGGRQRQLT
jgi:ATP-dependent RNA helicase DeaD